MAKFGIGQAVKRVEDQRFLTGKGDMSTISTCRTRLMPSPSLRLTRMRA